MNKKPKGYWMIHLVLIIFAILCIVPFLAVVSISLSSEAEIAAKGYSIIPRGFSMRAYQFILKSPKTILQAYAVTIFVSVFGTIASVILMSLCAYPISRTNFTYRSKISFFIFFTMLFNGGLVPTYIWVAKYLHLNNTIGALIFPMMISPWYLLLLRTFFRGIPYEIIESATIDGATEFTIYWKLILPLSKPAIATVTLFMLLNYWNDWFNGLLYIDKQSLVNLQYMLYRMMGSIQELQNAMMAGVVDATDLANLPNNSARMAMCVLAAGPMLFVFPFFQKYFVKGLTVGSVKG